MRIPFLIIATFLFPSMIFAEKSTGDEDGITLEQAEVLNVGMTQKEVIAILGKPIKCSVNPCNANLSDCAWKRKDGKGTVSVGFEKGKLFSVGDAEEFYDDCR